MSTAAEQHEVTEEPQEIPAEIAEAMKQAVARGIVQGEITRTLLPSPGMKYGRLADLAPDVTFTLPEGAPEPMAFSFFTPDGSKAYIMVCSPAMKAAMLELLTGGLTVASPADLAAELAKS